MLSAIFFRCHLIYFPIFFNYWNFGRNGMIAISNSAIKHKKLTFFFNFSPICLHSFSFQTLSLYFLFDTSYTCSHIRKLLFLHAFFEDKKRRHVWQANTIVWWRRRNRNRVDTDRFGPVPSRQSFSDRTELRRDGEVPVIVKKSV
jgi:hypothetical protein